MYQRYFLLQPASTFLIILCCLLVNSSFAQTISFSSSDLSGENLNAPTSLQFGPDGRLYVSQQDGTIYAYTIVRNGPTSYSVTNTETILLVKNMPNHYDDGTLYTNITKRQVTGILVTGTAAVPVLYVSSSDPRIGGNGAGTDTNLDTNSGVISRLTKNGGTWTKVDLVRGLPRSEENHACNGMQLDEASNILYLAQGGHTNMGAPSNNFANTPEYALSAAILSIDLTAIGNSTYDIPTLDDPTRANVGGQDVNDPFGGNDGLNQAMLVVGGPVQVYSPGYRNIYDVLITTAGKMYTWDNGPNSGWGDPPTDCTNTIREPGSAECDYLHYVSGPGYYGGHANPTRANYNNTFGGNHPVPASMINSAECTYIDPGDNGEITGICSSTNGICEYTASNFNNALNGDILAAAFNGILYRIELNAAGNALGGSGKTQLASGYGSEPLDVIAQGDGDIFPGTIWICTYGSSNIRVLEPNDFATCNPILTSYTNDADNDGYSDADENDNGTNPCSPAAIPEDFDNDNISDLNDPDDDNDGINDMLDIYAVDPNNGTTTTIPIQLVFNNSPIGGIKGWGFTGLMNNGSNYQSLYDPDEMTVGGTALKFTIDNVTAGDAYQGLNNQEYAFQFGLNVSAQTLPFVAHTRIFGPFLGFTPSNFQSMGLFIGTGDQDNYLKMVCAANDGAGGFNILLEENGNAMIDTYYSASILNSSFVDIFLQINPVTNTVIASYSVDGGAKTLLPDSESSIPSSWLDNILAVGIISTSNGASPFPATWDMIEVVAAEVDCSVLPGGSDCDDGDACTQSDVCANGVCGGTLVVCSNDNNVCTIDVCANGVCGVNNTSPCNDNNACTGSDACSGGVCGGSPILNCCQTNADCNDQNSCTTDMCTANVCSNTPIPDCCSALEVVDLVLVNSTTNQDIGPLHDGSIINLASTPDINIRADLCPGPVGSVKFIVNSQTFTENVAPYALAGDNNGNYYSWDPNTGSYTIQAIPYSAGNGGGNQGIAKSITITVINVIVNCNGVQNGTSCTDNNACTQNDICSSGICGGTVISGCCISDSDCVDGNACTNDACSAGSCVFTNNTLACNDNNACTSNDVCAAGECTGSTIVCDDGDACTSDACNSISGCSTTPIVCDDENACTTDACDSISGCSATPIVCDDENACTTDACDSISGCSANPIVCDDGNACTTDDCNSISGCSPTPIICDDGDACTTDDCDSISGCSTTPVVCDDGNACTTDDCDSISGCSATPIVCDDGNACTTDACDSISGCSTTPIVCDDENVCTTDACDSISGCSTTPIVCDDGDACTTDDCDSISGCSATPIVCDDGDACTTDDCDSISGCSATPIICDDFNSCTSNSCSAGICLFQPLCILDDGDVCTEDLCVAGECIHTVLICNDDDVCTENDTCVSGACAGSPIPGCPGVSLIIKVFLGGPYDSTTGLMGDSLRKIGYVPLEEPYSDLNLALGFFPSAGPGGGETIDTSVLLVSGDSAVVDWIYIQLRSKDDSTQVLATRSAVLLRNGTVAEVDGKSPLSFAGVADDNYYVVARHRNHLGVMTLNPWSLSASTVTIDFTDPATLTYGTGAQNVKAGKNMLWSGNVVYDGTLKYSGPDNDRDPILTVIGGATPTAVSMGYKETDLNMDGKAKYSGPNNDRDIILVNIGGAVPTATKMEQLPH